MLSPRSRPIPWLPGALPTARPSNAACVRTHAPPARPTRAPCVCRARAARAQRLGEIEHVPLADASVDVVTSNCVINLSDEKGQVMREAYRLLRPGGRVAISDVVRTADLPDRLRTEAALAC